MVSARLDEKLEKKLDELKEKDGVEKTTVIEDLVALYFEKLEDTGKRHSYIISELEDVDVS